MPLYLCGPFEAIKRTNSPNVSVSLSSDVDDLRVVVVIREENTGRRVDRFHHLVPKMAFKFASRKSIWFFTPRS